MTSTGERSSRTKQRRGKKDANDKDISPSPTTTAPLEAQMARAQAAVLQAQRQTAALHAQWRTYLLRLSYLLIIVSMHQMQGPAASCLRDIKALNAVSAEHEQIPGARAVVLVLSDAVPYVLSIIMAALLAFFLSLPEPGTFSHPRYLLANTLLPPLIGVHFMYKDWPSCLQDDLLARIQPEPRTRTLPVVVVYHVIVTVCVWFMDYQQGQQARNIRMVQDLQRDLGQARQVQEGTPGGRNNGTGSKSKKKN